jgi:hypothetical protein
MIKSFKNINIGKPLVVIISRHLLFFLKHYPKFKVGGFYLGRRERGKEGMEKC